MSREACMVVPCRDGIRVERDREADVQSGFRREPETDQ